MIRSNAKFYEKLNGTNEISSKVEVCLAAMFNLNHKGPVLAIFLTHGRSRFKITLLIESCTCNVVLLYFKHNVSLRLKQHQPI